MHKNEIFNLTITDMSINGEGIGRYGGMPFFVAGAVTGDRITASVTKLKKSYGYARIISIDAPSPHRTSPLCSISDKCGGCSIMSMSYEAQLAWKESFVDNTLLRIAGISDEDITRAKRPIVGMEDPYHFRNKSQYPVGKDKNGRLVAGFYAPRSHRIIPIITSEEDPQKDKIGCMISPAIDRDILLAVLLYMKNEGIEPYDETTGKGQIRHVLIRHGFSTGEIMVCIIANAKRLPGEDKLSKVLTAIKGVSSVVINTNTRRDNVILGDRVRAVFGNEYIEDELLGNRFRISARSFFQVNSVQTERLYSKAMEYASLSGSETVWDLYCGIGTISLSAAGRCARVVGIESVPDAITDAEENARINDITNAHFICKKAEDILEDPGSESVLSDDPEVIIVDPPRKGLNPVVISAITSRAPERIVYISCNPSTLARDLALLIPAGYSLTEYTPFDQFCHSSHVETVALLGKQNGKPLPDENIKELAAYLGSGNAKPDDTIEIRVDADKVYEILDREKEAKESK